MNDTVSCSQRQLIIGGFLSSHSNFHGRIMPVSNAVPPECHTSIQYWSSALFAHRDFSKLNLLLILCTLHEEYLKYFLCWGTLLSVVFFFLILVNRCSFLLLWNSACLRCSFYTQGKCLFSSMEKYYRHSCMAVKAPPEIMLLKWNVVPVILIIIVLNRQVMQQSW